MQLKRLIIHSLICTLVIFGHTGCKSFLEYYNQTDVHIRGLDLDTPDSIQGAYYIDSQICLVARKHTYCASQTKSQQGADLYATPTKIHYDLRATDTPPQLNPEHLLIALSENSNETLDQPLIKSPTRKLIINIYLVDSSEKAVLYFESPDSFDHRTGIYMVSKDRWAAPLYAQECCLFPPAAIVYVVWGFYEWFILGHRP